MRELEKPNGNYQLKMPLELPLTLNQNTVPSRPPVNQGNNDNEQTDRGIGSFVMNQAISSATGSKNHGSGGGGVQSFIMNQVVSSVTGSNKHHNGSGSGSDLVLLDWLVAYYLVVVPITTTTTIIKIKINLQWDL